jgi:hypothetical protein
MRGGLLTSLVESPEAIEAVKQRTVQMSRAAAPPVLDLAGAALAFLLAPLAFGWKRAHVREVEAEIVRTEEEEPRPQTSVERPRLREVDPIAAPAAPSVSLGGWSCEIAVWRDGDDAVFYARSFHDGVEIPLAESFSFRTPGDGPPVEDAATKEAHRVLCRELTNGGWVRVGGGAEWYSDRFRRAFSVAALNASLKTRIVFARRP